MKICVIGASGKLGKYLVQLALDRGYEVVGVCREQSVGKLASIDVEINRRDEMEERPGTPPYFPLKSRRSDRELLLERLYRFKRA